MAIYQNIAAVVVLYNPGRQVLENVDSIKDQLRAVIVVDNSDKNENLILSELKLRKNVILIQNSGNIGIASALNQAARCAINQGFEFLLTLDQDSRPHPGMIDVLLSCYEAGVGMVVPFLLLRPGLEAQGINRNHPVLTAMTSGSLLRLTVYEHAGPFRDEFFIDFVDIEYCLRLQKFGYKVIQAGNARLEHNVGTRIGSGAWLSVTTHSPLRKYYKTRNRLQVWKEFGRIYPGYILKDRFRFVLELFRLFLFEPERKAKVCMMWKGLRDYRRGKFGKYDEYQG